MNIQDQNNDFARVEKLLHQNGFNNIKRWVGDRPYTITALEVYSAPIMMSTNIIKIRNLIPNYSVTGNTNQSYILIKQL